MLVEADDRFELFVELAIAEHALDLGQAQGHRGLDAMGAGHQFGRALGAGVTRVGLGDRLEETDLQPGVFQGANQAEADGIEAAAETGRG